MEKKIYAVGIIEDGVSYDIHFYDNKEEAEKTLHYYKYATNSNAYITEYDLESESDKVIPKTLFVEAKFNYRNHKCRFDNININTYQKLCSMPENDFKNEKVVENKSDRCGVHSTTVNIKFIIDTKDNETREELEERCKEKTKEIYENK